jgi:threonine dehydrogenase-like Zn-dependent dehydrogenase
VEYAGVPDGGSLLVLGLGPIGDMACRIAQQKWIDKIIAVDLWTSGWSERWPAASR